MSIVKFKVAAKTDIGLVRTNNEDNFQISWDLSAFPMRWTNNEVRQLGNKGCLLVVADGMGGANAGEVASQIAIDSIRTSFAPENITYDILRSNETIKEFIRNAIITADDKIKKYAAQHPETRGMGTTIVVAWIYKAKLFVGWCGDSRAYIFNPTNGLVRLSKDHSYVQQLVDRGRLSPDEAFDFPESNIITQCLSASSQRCSPETLSRPVELCDNDTIMLCTDGVCGMIRDAQIESILLNSDDNIADTADALIGAALRASGSDNATLCLMKIISGCPKASCKRYEDKAKPKNMYWILAVAGFLVVAAIVAWLVFGRKVNNEDSKSEISTAEVDSLYKEGRDSAASVAAENYLNQASEHSPVPRDNGKSHDGGGTLDVLISGISTVPGLRSDSGSIKASDTYKGDIQVKDTTNTNIPGVGKSWHGAKSSLTDSIPGEESDLEESVNEEGDKTKYNQDEQ